MGTGSSKNNDVVAFEIGGEEKEKKKETNNNKNKNNSWESEAKKEEKLVSRLGVSIRK